MHMAGKLCDMLKISKIAKKHNLKIIEDAAHAACSAVKKKKAGYYADVVAFSCNAMKTLHAYGELGVVSTNNKEIYNKIKVLRHAGTFNSKKNIIEKINTSNEISLNHKSDAIQCAFAIENLRNLNNLWKKRDKIANYYNENLPKNMLVQTLIKNEKHGRYLYVIKIKRRKKLKIFLKKNGIETRVVYMPLINQTNSYNQKELIFPKSITASNTVLALPLHEKMIINEAKYVVKYIKKFYENQSNI